MSLSSDTLEQIARDTNRAQADFGDLQTNEYGPFRLIYWEEQASGTAGNAGANFVQAGWRTRFITTEHADNGEMGSLAANQITLEAGIYYCRISAPAFRVDSHMIRLYDITGAATLLLGTSEFCTSGANTVQTRSFITGRFELTVQSALEVQHYCQTTRNGNGFGNDAGFGVNEKYTVAEFVKVS